jgi:hypothetical protein
VLYTDETLCTFINTPIAVLQKELETRNLMEIFLRHEVFIVGTLNPYKSMEVKDGMCSHQ